MSMSLTVHGRRTHTAHHRSKATSSRCCLSVRHSGRRLLLMGCLLCRNECQRLEGQTRAAVELVVHRSIYAALSFLSSAYRAVVSGERPSATGGLAAYPCIFHRTRILSFWSIR